MITYAQEAEVEDSLDFWSGPVQSYISPVEHRFLIGLDCSTNGPLPDCDHKYVPVHASWMYNDLRVKNLIEKNSKSSMVYEYQSKL